MNPVPFAINARYPDPAVEVLDDEFLALRLYSAIQRNLDELSSEPTPW